MKSLQEGGRKELDALRNRVRRSFGMGRISDQSFGILMEAINKLDADLINTPEHNTDRREF